MCLLVTIPEAVLGLFVCCCYFVLFCCMGGWGHHGGSICVFRKHSTLNQASTHLSFLRRNLAARAMYGFKLDLTLGIGQVRIRVESLHLKLKSESSRMSLGTREKLPLSCLSAVFLVLQERLCSPVHCRAS